MAEQPITLGRTWAGTNMVHVQLASGERVGVVNQRTELSPACSGLRKGHGLVPVSWLIPVGELENKMLNVAADARGVRRPCPKCVDAVRRLVAAEAMLRG